MTDGIDKETLFRLFETMLRIRLFEDRVVRLYPGQEMKCPVHLCIGQEAIAAGVCLHLKKEDYIFSTHRSHGHCIAKGMGLRPLAAELYGRSTGCSRGRGGSMHLTDPENGIPGTTAIVGGCIPIAVGAALSAQMKRNGRIAVAFFGDGAVEEGTFHEGLNYASLRRLPVIFVCENNFYATNSPQKARQPEVNIADRAAGYGMPGVAGDGNDVMFVHDSCREAVERARSGGGPTLLEFRTYRWKAHVGPDSDIAAGCRPAAEYEEWVRRCPLELCGQRLIKEKALTEDDIDRLTGSIEAEIDDAVEFAMNSPFPQQSEILDHVY
ncbi:MAG: thiamine pyrophosphate-dependent dehydrogenase E1 component subunit alpha [Nitrospiraceae bacterium]|nr:thiamine pyrophosphate-dependent dehydrogenase E1 component subunit alpha [Nitrospiraceae bacterium]